MTRGIAAGYACYEHASVYRTCTSHECVLLDQLQNIPPSGACAALRVMPGGQGRTPVRRAAFEGWAYGAPQGAGALKERSADRCTEFLGGRRFEHKGGAELLGFGLQHGVRYSRRHDCRQITPCSFTPQYQVQSVIFAEANVCHQQDRRNTKPFEGLLERIGNRHVKPEGRGRGNGKHGVREDRVDD